MENAASENKNLSQPSQSHESQADETAQKQANPEDRVTDPMDLVYKGGFEGNPREIVENPAVAPQMPDGQVTDARASLMQRDYEPEE